MFNYLSRLIYSSDPKEGQLRLLRFVHLYYYILPWSLYSQSIIQNNFSSVTLKFDEFCTDLGWKIEWYIINPVTVLLFYLTYSLRVCVT